MNSLKTLVFRMPILSVSFLGWALVVGSLSGCSNDNDRGRFIQNRQFGNLRGQTGLNNPLSQTNSPGGPAARSPFSLSGGGSGRFPTGGPGPLTGPGSLNQGPGALPGAGGVFGGPGRLPGIERSGKAASGPNQPIEIKIRDFASIAGEIQGYYDQSVGELDDDGDGISNQIEMRDKRFNGNFSRVVPNGALTLVMIDLPDYVMDVARGMWKGEAQFSVRSPLKWLSEGVLKDPKLATGQQINAFLGGLSRGYMSLCLDKTKPFMPSAASMRILKKDHKEALVKALEAAKAEADEDDICHIKPGENALENDPNYGYTGGFDPGAPTTQNFLAAIKQDYTLDQDEHAAINYVSLLAETDVFGGMTADTPFQGYEGGVGRNEIRITQMVFDPGRAKNLKLGIFQNINGETYRGLDEADYGVIGLMINEKRVVHSVAPDAVLKWTKNFIHQFDQSFNLPLAELLIGQIIIEGGRGIGLISPLVNFPDAEGALRDKVMTVVRVGMNGGVMMQPQGDEYWQPMPLGYTHVASVVSKSRSAGRYLENKNRDGKGAIIIVREQPEDADARAGNSGSRGGSGSATGGSGTGSGSAAQGAAGGAGTPTLTVIDQDTGETTTFTGQRLEIKTDLPVNVHSPHGTLNTQNAVVKIQNVDELHIFVTEGLFVTRLPEEVARQLGEILADGKIDASEEPVVVDILQGLTNDLSPITNAHYQAPAEMLQELRSKTEQLNRVLQWAKQAQQAMERARAPFDEALEPLGRIVGELEGEE